MNWQTALFNSIRASNVITERLLHMEELLKERDGGSPINIDFNSFCDDIRNNAAIIESALKVLSGQ